MSKRSCLRVFGEYNSSSHDTEEELSHPMGRDKAKSAVQKGKGKAGSSSQSGSESLGVGGGHDQEVMQDHQTIRESTIIEAMK
jgi:hypothetical protein